MLRERLEMVQEEMDKLKEPNRTLLMLHDVEEVPIAELTGRFEMTAESVKSRLKRARAQVRDNLLARSAAHRRVTTPPAPAPEAPPAAG